MTATRGTAVVSGAAQGIGRTFAVALAAAGHDIAIIDTQAADETAAAISSLGREVITHVADASDPVAVSAFGDAVRGRLTRVRVLVNNAGISPYSPFPETTLDMWHQLLRVNLDSMFLITQEFLPDLVSGDDGRIVNMTSSVVWDFQATNMTAYATTKAGIVGFTRALAGEVGHLGVTVNCIAPGIVLTPDIEGRVPAERLDTYRDRQAIKRLAVPEDLVPALDFLVSERSGHITGTIVPVNGGRVVL
jgi:3-oxoacyl-[acyl-carrier protein] reductase/(S)-1-phenylethanol dehydrogenase